MAEDSAKKKSPSMTAVRVPNLLFTVAAPARQRRAGLSAGPLGLHLRGQGLHFCDHSGIGCWYARWEVSTSECGPQHAVERALRPKALKVNVG